MVNRTQALVLGFFLVVASLVVICEAAPAVYDQALRFPDTGGDGRCAGQRGRRNAGAGGADHAGELGFDEGLVDGLGGLADAVVDVCGLECVQDLQQCRLVKGHRALCPFARTIGVVSLTIARWPLRRGRATPSRPATYTTCMSV
jgi:hypothetical protein